MSGNNGEKKIAVALGNFDGLHTGHIAVLSESLKLASSGFIPTVLLFTQHTRKGPDCKGPEKLITDSEREEIITSMGMDFRYIDFASVRDMTPEEFVRGVLIEKLNAGAVSCGYNFRFGKGACGDARTLTEICAGENIICTVAGEIDFEGMPVSSSEIRKLVMSGNVERAGRLLGRPFGFSAVITDGNKIGRTLGFPTINQIIPAELAVPRYGVYRSLTTIDGAVYKSISNVGCRPTVGTDELVCETHIFDFSDDVYGKTADVRFLDFIRPEKRFESLRELSEQIAKDTEAAKSGKR